MLDILIQSLDSQDHNNVNIYPSNIGFMLVVYVLFYNFAANLLVNKTTLTMSWAFLTKM